LDPYFFVKKSSGTLQIRARLIPRNKEIAEFPIHRLKLSKTNAKKYNILIKC
jgi:hypothetical protein